MYMYQSMRSGTRPLTQYLQNKIRRNNILPINAMSGQWQNPWNVSVKSVRQWPVDNRREGLGFYQSTRSLFMKNWSGSFFLQCDWSYMLFSRTILFCFWWKLDWYYFFPEKHTPTPWLWSDRYLMLCCRSIYNHNFTFTLVHLYL